MLNQLFARPSPAPPTAVCSPPYQPSRLTHVEAIGPSGEVRLAIAVYFPVPPVESAAWQVQFKLGRQPWQFLEPPTTDGYWRRKLEGVRPGAALRFRYRRHGDRWRSISPLTALERVYETFYIPRLTYRWQHQLPYFEHAKILMETTLEGVLAGYIKGVFAPRSREEMFLSPIARQILQTDISNQLAELGVDGIIAPLASSMADRSHLEPKLNYLTYDVADIDWQLGRAEDMMSAIDAFHSKGLDLVPDLNFAHQVRTPFAGSLDGVSGPAGRSPYVDPEASLLHDYGTWMFALQDPEVRRQLVEKIVTFAACYRSRILRLGYLDGIVWQYSQRETDNYGVIFLQELKAELKSTCPQTLILGETFAELDNPDVADCIDIFYTPSGFPIAEALYEPPDRRSHPLQPDSKKLDLAVREAVSCSYQSAVYAMLHDETRPERYVSDSRADTPWAYGSNPAELAKNQGLALVDLGLLTSEELLDYVRRTVRNVEALTMFCARLIYMFSPSVDSLELGSLESPGRWKLNREDVTAEQLNFWGKQRLGDRQIYLLHRQHRADMGRLRQIFRDYTLVDPESQQPQTQVRLHHCDLECGVLSLWRHNSQSPAESLFVIFNLGPKAFKSTAGSTYKVPSPPREGNKWEVLFDGDWVDPLFLSEDRSHFLDSSEDIIAYGPGEIIPTREEEPTDLVRLELGAFSLIVLKVHIPLESSI